MLDHLRVAAHKAFTGRVLTDTPFPIKCELMGSAADPQVACLHMALKFAVRIHVKGNAWLHMMGLPSKKWYHFTPVLTSFLAQQRWTVHPSGDFIQRTDSYGHLRTWHLGVDRLCIVFEWIANVFRAEFLHKSKRIFGVHKRHQEEGLARGRDDLPPTREQVFAPLPAINNSCLNLIAINFICMLHSPPAAAFGVTLRVNPSNKMILVRCVLWCTLSQ